MEMNNKPEKHINDIVGSEALYHPTIKERVLGSKVAKGIVYAGVVILIYSSLAMGVLAEDPPTPPYPGGPTVQEPKGKNKGWEDSQGNHYHKGWEDSQGNHYHKGWEE